MPTKRVNFGAWLACVGLLAAGAEALSLLGCYSASGSLKLASTYNFQSSGYCYSECNNGKNTYMALSNGDECWCGTALPSSSDLTDSSSCSTACVGYDKEMCGGSDSWSVYSLGDSSFLVSADPSVAGSSSSSKSSSGSSSQTSSSSTTSSSASSSSSTESTTSTTSESSSTTSTVSSTSNSANVRTTAVTTVSNGTTRLVVTQTVTEAHGTSTSSSSSIPSSSQGNGSKISGGAIAGIVIGVLAGLALIGLAIFFFRRRGKQQTQDKFANPLSPDDLANSFGMPVSPSSGHFPSARGANVNANANAMNNAGMGMGMGVGGGSSEEKEYTSGETFLAIDQRLNPIMLGERRLSSNSLADDRDYSRKILRVANPDGDL